MSAAPAWDEDVTYFSSPRSGGSRERARALAGEFARAWLELACARCTDPASDPAGTPPAALRGLLQGPLPWEVLLSREFFGLTWRTAGNAGTQALRESVQAVVDRSARHPRAPGPQHGPTRAPPGGGDFRLYLARDPVPCPLPAGRVLVSVAPEHVGAAVDEALALIDGVAPEYGRWVTDAIHSVVALDGSDGVRYSAGPPEHPGLVFLTFPAETIDVAAMLVHEASHQYFMVLESLLRLHDGTDTREYYSPIKRRGRRIGKILFAFHAFGNGALFDREALRCGARAPGFASTLEQDIRILDEHYAHLRATPALTPTGRRLCDPLAAQLFEA